jgi:hypothetical protein
MASTGVPWTGYIDEGRVLADPEQRGESPAGWYPACRIPSLVSSRGWYSGLVRPPTA